ncbi:MAG TPA: fibronectin type III domain-containing protein [Anaerolineae bacterium]|nr:fibronectin type III domain-containing protein [Anaerolineae bacterium]
MTQKYIKGGCCLFLTGLGFWFLFGLTAMRPAGSAGALRPLSVFAAENPQTMTYTLNNHLYLPLALRDFSLNAPPISPSHIYAMPISYSQVRVEWRDNAFNETGYLIYEGNNLIATLGANVISYTAGGFEPLSYHCFTVYASNDNGRSDWSGWACAVTMPRGVVCVEGLRNGGFESDVAWELPHTEYPASYTTARWHSGARAMRTGIVTPFYNLMSYSSAQQVITIPTTALTVTIRFWLYHQSSQLTQQALSPPPTRGTPLNDVATLRAGDEQYVTLLNTDNQVVETLFWDCRNDRAWQFYQYTLRGYAGKTIKIHIGTYNDGLDAVTGMYVDDVGLDICMLE